MADIQHLFAVRPVVIAHRGANREAPENTLAAFRLAAQQGAGAIELDVNLSKDKVPVVMHDPTVDRTTNGRGRVCDLPLANLKELDAGVGFAGRFSGERIPTLEEVFEQIPAGVWIDVELKNYTTPGDDLEGRVVDLVHRMNMSRRVLFSSFSLLTLLRVGRRAPEIPCAILTWDRQPLWLRRAWLGPLVRHESREPELAQASEKLMNTCHRAKRLVSVWVANEPQDIQRVAGLGVDGILTDVPGLTVSLLGGRRSGVAHAAG
ncbi:MAG: glycerophosphodiester phosphodiesterase family protein [Anaerolineales bacterium]|jgi:glycerophosphoryl diester phosphodiesterase